MEGAMIETIQQSSNIFGEEVFNPTKRLGQVILGWKDGNCNGFSNILTYYCPPPAVFVDLMAGPKNFYRLLGTDLNMIVLSIIFICSLP